MSEKKKKVSHAPANRCKKCGFKIGGKHHEDGAHHNSGSEGRTGKLRRH